MFTLGETASGAVVLAAFGQLLDRAVPLAVRAEIAYRKLAMGPVLATARLAPAGVSSVIEELDGPAERPGDSPSTVQNRPTEVRQRPTAGR